MIHECLEHGAQYACLAANINFNLEGLRIGFWQLTIDGLAWGAIYALVALGYTMVYGVLRLINFAHSEIFMIGTFGSLTVIQALGLHGTYGGFALFGALLICLVAAMIAAGGSAVVLEFVAYRPLRKKGSSRLAALISAIGASLFLQELFATLVIPHTFGNGRGRDYIGVTRL